jgi:hypothetical protein
MIKSKAIIYLKVIRFLDSYQLIFKSKVKFLFLLLLTYSSQNYKSTFKNKIKMLKSSSDTQKYDNNVIILNDLTSYIRTVIQEKLIKNKSKVDSLSNELELLSRSIGAIIENAFLINWQRSKKFKVYNNRLSVAKKIAAV